MSQAQAHRSHRPGGYLPSRLRESFQPEDMDDTPQEESAASQYTRCWRGSCPTEDDNDGDDDADGDDLGEKRPTELVAQNTCPICLGNLNTVIFDTTSRLRESHAEAFVPTEKTAHYCVAKHFRNDDINVVKAGPSLILPRKVATPCILVACNNCSQSRFGRKCHLLLQEEERRSRSGRDLHSPLGWFRACVGSRKMERSLTVAIEEELRRRRPAAYWRLALWERAEGSRFELFLESTREPLLHVVPKKRVERPPGLTKRMAAKLGQNPRAKGWSSRWHN